VSSPDPPSASKYNPRICDVCHLPETRTDVHIPALPETHPDAKIIDQRKIGEH